MRFFFCVLLWSGAAFAANLVLNGGFETGDFPPWSESGSEVRCGTGFQHSGNCDVVTFGDQILDQNIPTVIGASYTLDFWLGTAFMAEVDVDWDGHLVFVSPSGGLHLYTHEVIPGLIATSTATQLR